MDFYFQGSSRSITAASLESLFRGAGLPSNVTVAAFVDHINNNKTKYDYLPKSNRNPGLALGASILSPPVRLRHMADYPDIAFPTTPTSEDKGTVMDAFSSATAPFTAVAGGAPPLPVPSQPVAPPSSSQVIPLPKAPVMDVAAQISALVASSLTSINLIPIHLFEFDGFDPMKIRKEVIRLGQAAFSVTEKLGEVIDVQLHGPHVHNDLNIMITLGLMRGNSVTKILRKSHKDIVNVIRRLDNVYQLSSPTGMLNLMRIVNSFPDVSIPTLKNGRGRNIVPDYTQNLVMANPVSFQGVSKGAFGSYAAHFFVLAYLTDKVVNKGKTSLTNLWNYMIMAYNSPIMQSRSDNIGPVTADPFSFIVEFPADIRAKIETKIDGNDCSRLE